MSSDEAEIFIPRKRAREELEVIECEKSDEEEESCPICYEYFSNSGHHRISSLKCGHLFGFECIKRWIQTNNGRVGCPKCNQSSCLRDIRILYHRGIKVIDTSEKTQLLEQLEQERNHKLKILTQLDAAKFRIQMLTNENTALKKQVKQTNFKFASLSNNDTENSSTLFKLAHVSEISKETSLRVMCFAPSTNSIYFAEPVHVGPFRGKYSIRSFDLQTMRLRAGNADHSGPVWCLSVQPSGNYLASGGEDKTLQIFSVHTDRKVHFFNAPSKVISCAFADFESVSDNFIFAGLDSGRVVLFDLRMTNRLVQEYNIDFNPHPRVQSLATVRRGLLIGQLNRVSLLRLPQPQDNEVEFLFEEDDPTQLENRDVVDLTSRNNNNEDPAPITPPPDMQLEELTLNGNLVCLCSLPKSNKFLATFRSTRTIPQTRYLFGQVNPQSASEIATFHGPEQMPKLVRSTLFKMDEKICGLAGDFSSRGAVIWNAESSEVIQKIKPPKVSSDNIVMDACTLSSAGNKIAILSQKEFPKPTTLWGQDDDYVYLTVQVLEAANVYVDIGDEALHFECAGYSFDIDLFLPVINDRSGFTICDQNVKIKLKKEHVACWSRLTLRKERLSWLKIDFDRFSQENSDDSDTEYDGNQQESNINVKFVKPTPEERARHDKERELIDAEEDWNEFVKFIKNPLVIYALLLYIFQLAGAISIAISTCSVKLNLVNVTGRFTHKYSFLVYVLESETVFTLNVDRVCLMNLVLVIECLSVVFHMEKHLNLVSQVQRTFARNLVVFCALLPFENVRNDDSVGTLFMLWALWDIVRYVRLLVMTVSLEDNGFLCYLWHTVWIVLHPTCFILEGWLLVKALPSIAESKAFALNLHWPLEINLYFSWIVHLHLVFSAVHLCRSMRRKYFQRRNTIGPKPRKGTPEYSGLKGLLGGPYWDFLKRSLPSSRPVTVTKQERILERVSASQDIATR
ncbi:hypothetical protein Ciccas_005037 [Cichlidogyrus casuarinus]|uniref:Protein-tyrosine phosphatase-like A domain-containing protein 1 n=1 Tax=Cichlidogyrus casuarinus TaxID=1844966 RepID=A0ABD2Q9S8_9PLAT